MKKFFTTVFMVASVLVATAQTVSTVSEEMQLLGESMSANCKYVVGTNYTTFNPTIWVVDGNTYVNFETLEEGQFHGISNNGIAVGAKTYAVKANTDGTWSELYADKGELIEEDWGSYYTGEAGSDAWGITPDGNIIVGDYFDANYITRPCLWIGDKRVDLPLPEADAVPFEFDGAGARYISDDGKVILGYLNDNFGLWPACIWRQSADGTYVCDPICKDYYMEEPGQGKPFMSFEGRGISANGEWITLVVCPEYDMWNWEQPKIQCARLNLKTKELNVYGDGSQVISLYGIANDGTAVGFEDTGSMFGRKGAVWFPGKSAPSMFSELFSGNEYFESVTGDMGCCAPGVITSDAKKIQGFAMTNDEKMDISSFIVDTPAEPTAINDLTVTPVTKEVKGTYDLTGRRVNENNLTHGIYIIDGKKVVK